MKRMMNIFSLIAIVLMSLGFLFKIQHWPGSALVLIASQGFLCIFYLPVFYLYKRKELGNWKARFTYGFGLFCFSVFMIAVLAKIMHWPGAGGMFALAMVLFSLVFIPAYTIGKVKQAGSKAAKGMHVSGGVVVALITLGLLFKLMHWPGAGPSLILGILLIPVLYLPFFMMAHKNDPGNRISILINLYFAITALSVVITLSLNNTSGIILNSFAFVDEMISEANVNTEIKNKALVTAFSENADDKAGEYVQKIKKVQALSNELCNYIAEMKSYLIVKTDGMSKSDADSTSLRDVDAKDNYDMPTHLLIGGDPENLREGSFSARELRNKIRVYKMDMLNMLKDTVNNGITKTIGLNTNDRNMEDGQMHSWETSSFDHMTLAVDVTILSELQNNVRNAEAQIILALTDENNHKAEGIKAE
jgi:hypothetical protein